MNPQFDLYEKLYFHEIESREHLSARVQIPLAITISIIGVLAFMLLNFDKQYEWDLTTHLFVVLFLASGISLSVAVYFLVRSWYGYAYSFLPSAENTEEYRKLLLTTYCNYNNGNNLAENHLNDYLCNYFIKCSTVNTHCNDERSLRIHKANGYLIITTVLAALAFLFFYFGDLSKTEHTKPLEISIVQPIELKGNDMVIDGNQTTNSNPPPPPAPPPVRVIKEGVEIVKPKGN